VGGNVDINNNNYRYTEIGELESDALEGIEEIIWRVDSKISEVRFLEGSGKDDLRYAYDALGNRVAKYVMDGQTSFAKHVTYYVRDASGNVMAVYEHDLETPESYHLAERHIYGSSRVGMITEKVEFEYVYGNQPTEELVSTLLIEETVNFELEYTIGSRQYELSNHLGNVLAVISDWKLPVISGASVVSYTTVVVSSQDYSPFGVTLSGRSWSEGYRYGFQNQETDEELWDGAINYKYRVEDARLGRFFSVDPLFKDYAYNSTYAFSENRVIDGVELEGLEYQSANGEAKGPLKADYAAKNKMSLEKEFRKSNSLEQGQPLPIISASKTNKTNPNSDNTTGLGYYKPQFTANLSANAGISADLGLVGGTLNYAGVTILGLDNNDIYVLGHNNSNDIGREINKEYSFNAKSLGAEGAKLITSNPMNKFTSEAFNTGFSYKELRIGSRNSEAILTQYTSKMFGFIYVESNTDLRTGKTSNSVGLAFDVSIGIGLVVNGGVKWPIYKN
jgi:RHS repeat-associated protein